MKASLNFLGHFASIFLFSQLLVAPMRADAKPLEKFYPAADLKAMLEALAQVEPVALDQLPKETFSSFGYWSFQNPAGPPLPYNPLKLKG